MHEIFTKSIVSEAGAIILQIVYGYSIEPQTADPLVLLIEPLMSLFDSKWRREATGRHM